MLMTKMKPTSVFLSKADDAGKIQYQNLFAEKDGERCMILMVIKKNSILSNMSIEYEYSTVFMRSI